MVRLLEEERYHVPFLLFFSLLLYLPFLGSRDLWAPVEPRYGEIARVMFTQGEWIVPAVNGELYTDKPILYFWLVLVFSHLAGAVNEWAVRLPSALSSVGLVAVVYLLGKDFFNRQAGLLAALVFATTARVLWEARWAHSDMTFVLFFTLSLRYLLHALHSSEENRRVLWAYLFMGLATLTKGFIGIVLPGLILSLLLVLGGDIKKLRGLKPVSGILVFLLTASPWFAAVTLRTEGTWMKEFFWTHHVQRFLSGLGHREPFYYYFLNFPLDFLPWSLFLIPAAIACYPQVRRITRPVPLSLAVWFLAVWVFFSLSDTKRGLYLLPLYPPAALLLARYLLRLQEGEASGIRILDAILPLFFTTLWLAAISLPFAASWLQPELVTGSILFAFVMVLGTLLALRSLRRRDIFASTFFLALTMLGGMLCSSSLIFPVIDRYKSPRALAVEIGKKVAPADPLYIYADRMNDFNFYLKRQVIPVLSNPGELAQLAAKKSRPYLLIRERDLSRVRTGVDSRWELVIEGAIGGKKWQLLRLR